MEGLMQSYDLSVLKLLDHAAKYHSDAGIYSFSSKNVKSFRSWAEARHRARALAVGLQGLGVKPGDRVATLAYNTSRHMEVWFGIMGTGAVCHTLNPRLFLDDIDYIANDAGDTFLLADPELADLARQLAPRVPSLRAVIWLDDVIPKTAKAPRFSRELLAEDLIKDASVVLSGGWDWVRVPETAACGLCYTSGTTGRPKGVLYSHRANVLHALAIMLPDSFALSSSSTILNVVPLFHANGWGLPFAAAASGATLVMPGPNLDGASLLRVMSDVGVTMTAGVPTIWMALMQEMERTGRSLPKLKIVGVAGSACPAIVMDFFESRGTQVRHAWGMTECCPIVTIASAKKSVQEAPNNPWAGLRLRQGMPHALCELRVVDENGKEAPMDGKTSGNIQIRGPHVLSQYYKKGVSATDADGWFDTGDVGNLSPEGYMQITDRSKDVIKSGGEWISSIEIENAAVGHPDVAEAAVIAVPHPKWTERPLLLVVPKAGRTVTRDSMLKFLQPLLAKWWLPEDVVSIKEIPHTATGKINKLRLRQLYGGYSFGGDEAPRAKL